MNFESSMGFAGLMLRAGTQKPGPDFRVLSCPGMLTPITVFAVFAALAYGTAVWLSLRGRAGAGWVSVIALGLHLLTLLAGLKAAQNHLGLALALSLVTWQTALLLSLLWRVAALSPLRTLIYPLAALGGLLAALPATGSGADAPQNWKIALHAALSIFAAGLLTLAAAQALALEALDRLLHRPDQLPKVLRLPPMQASEDWLFQLIAAGFFVLSLALLSGLIFVDDLFAQHLAHKTILSLIAWAIFAALLLGRLRWGWRGRRAVRFALSGYAALLLAYFGSKLVLEQILGRHWGS